MRVSKLLLCILIHINIHTRAQWNITTISTPPLPRSDYSQAVGYYNGTVYIFGGTSIYQQAWSEYVVSSNTMIDRGNDSLPYLSYGVGQYYTQMHGKLYWIYYNTIYFYDYIFKNFTDLATTPIGVSHYACLTSYNDLLFILGGDAVTDPIQTAQVFNLSISEWIEPIANLSRHRREPACAVDAHRGVVYVIAGDSDRKIDGVIWRPDFETLEIGDNITQSRWMFNQSKALDYASFGLRATYIKYNDSILVVGGDTTLPDISIIDCETGKVSAVAKLNYVSVKSGHVFVHNSLYLFGGWTADYYHKDTSQRITNPLVFGQPTSNPTNEPTAGPLPQGDITTSAKPTSEPTVDPLAQYDTTTIDYTSTTEDNDVEKITANVTSQDISGQPATIPTKEPTDDALAQYNVTTIDDASTTEDNDDERITVNIESQEVVIPTTTFNNNDHDKGGEYGETTDNKTEFMLILIVIFASIATIIICTLLWYFLSPHIETNKVENRAQSISSKHPHAQINTNPMANTHGYVFDSHDAVVEHSNDEESAEGVTGLKGMSTEQILHWILSIEDGVFMSYEHVLRQQLFQRELRGKDLINLDENDFKLLGIDAIEYRQLLKYKILEETMEKTTKGNESTSNSEANEANKNVYGGITADDLDLSDSDSHVRKLNPRAEGSEHSGDSDLMFVVEENESDEEHEYNNYNGQLVFETTKGNVENDNNGQ